jgi:DNA modification methylase
MKVFEKRHAKDFLAPEISPACVTHFGTAYCGDSLELLTQVPDNSVSLVMTSPPFALQQQKEYGNKTQKKYIDWLVKFAKVVYLKLKDDGSFVLDLGGHTGKEFQLVVFITFVFLFVSVMSLVFS